MTTQPKTALSGNTSAGSLKSNSVGLFDVVFMAVATAAPIAAMTGNFPYIVGYGNGIYAPAAYMFATVVLTIFSIGYIAMARHITAAGAFYGYISHGLGQTSGMVAGMLATLAYVVFEVALACLSAYFVQDFALRQFSVEMHWMIPAIIVLILNSVLSYFHINLAAKILGLFLILEVAILAAGALATLFTGGGPDGLSVEPLRPTGAFLGESPGFGLFLAFWSWVGFESTAMYGEESKNPKDIIPRATLIAVLGVGLFYVFITWMLVAEHGFAQSLALGKGASPIDLVILQIQRHFGDWAVTLFQLLTLTGSFACGLAFHNCATRYIYAIGREGLIKGCDRFLGKTHDVHGSPYIASFTQTGFASAVICTAYLLSDLGPYDLFALIAVLGTMSILIVQVACSLAVVGYFTRVKPAHFHWLKTGVAPIVGAIAMAFVIVLLFQNKEAAVGEKLAKTWLFHATPWIVGGTAALGLMIAWALKIFSPERYSIVGRIVMEDTTEREDDTLSGLAMAK